MTTSYRVVFDCNIYFQALIAPTGPAGALLKHAAEGRFTLFASEYIFDEFCDITSRPVLVKKFQLTPERVAFFLEAVRQFAIVLTHYPQTFDLPRDPKDAPYVSLAIAVQASHLITRDTHLLDLARLDKPEGRDFTKRYPEITVLPPENFLPLVR